ncbi:MAG: hypothetical protein A2277_15965 [Desulfobacterales bacterium RIFOXYA12_FULL_46_15]|nr:MAG: hypothetical protein A2277_15965 [Desulfobacterales bacterium RIFOXYA12_FULL_46_15]
MKATIFETHYKEYCRQIAGLDFSSIKDTLGIELRGHEAVIPFFGENYIVSDTGIADESGNRPSYMVCVILSKYLLLCPGTPVVNKEWSALKDFHKMSQFTNLNFFTSDTEQPIVKIFSGRISALSEASRKLGGKPCKLGVSYDFAMEFRVLPKIEILLIFNDRDDEFPATCSVLFQKQAEDYLDPESLIMAGTAFRQRLQKLSE